MEGFGPAVALRAARTLLRVLEERGEEPAEPAVAVRPVAGALDHAAAAAVALALSEEGHAVTLEARPAQAVVLVLASGSGKPRLLRALRAARQLAPRVILMAATSEAEHAIAGAAAGPFLDDMEKLRAELAALLPPEDEAPLPQAAE